MMLTAIQTNTNRSVFAHSHNPAQNSTPQQDCDPQNGGHCGMDKNTNLSGSNSTSNPSLTPQLVPMAAMHPPQLIIGPGGGYTILPSLAPINGLQVGSCGEGTFGNLSLHTAGGNLSSTGGVGGSGGAALTRPITAIQATCFGPSSLSSTGAGVSGACGESGISSFHTTTGRTTTQQATSPQQQQQQQQQVIGLTPTGPHVMVRSHSTPKPDSLLLRNGNQTATTPTGTPPVAVDGVMQLQRSPESKPNINTLQQLVSPLRTDGLASNGVLTSSSSDPALHTSSTKASHGGDEFILSGRRRSNAEISTRVMQCDANDTADSTSPIKIKREPLTDDVIPRQSCIRRNSSSNVEEASSSRGAGSSSVKNPYPISALIDVPILTPLNRSSRTSSLSSSLSSFRFGGSLNQLWASQLSLSGNKMPNMKSTGNINADAAALPSLGNQYFAFGGSLPELSLTSLSRLLPNSSANDSNISSCPSLFTLFHSPLYVYPSQQQLTTPFINANGSISFGSFLSSGTSLCNTQKPTSSSLASATGSSTNDEKSLSASNELSSSNTTTTTTEVRSNRNSAIGESSSNSPGAFTQSPGSSVSGQEPIRLSMYSPLSGSILGPHVITALPAFSTLTRNLDPASFQQQSHSNSITSHTMTSSTHSSLAPIFSTANTSSPGSGSGSGGGQVSAPNLNTLACVATAQQQQMITSSTPPSSHPHHLPINHTSSIHSSAEHLHTHSSPADSKEGVLTLGLSPRSTDLYTLSPNQRGLIQGSISVNGIKLENDPYLAKSPMELPQTSGRGVPHPRHIMMASPDAASLPQQPLDVTHPSQIGTGSSGGVVREPKKEKEKPYKCDHPGCGRSFSFPAHLRSHIQQIHISYRPCKCEFPGCGKRFYTPQHLNVHRRVHTGERPFVCPYTECAKAFTTAGNLKNHIRTHTGERPYACKYEGCTKRFAEMSSLKKHELTHTGEKPYKCRVCGKAFSQAGSRNTHERKHNPTEDDDGSEGGVGGAKSRRYRIKRIPVVPGGVKLQEEPMEQ